MTNLAMASLTMRESSSGLISCEKVLPSALVMATTKNHAHRIPLQKGIYAHLELLFHRRGPQVLPWTYPDFAASTYHPFFMQARQK